MEFSRQESWSGFAISFSRGSSRPRDPTPGLPHCRQAPYHLSHLGSPHRPIFACKSQKGLRLQDCCAPCLGDGGRGCVTFEEASTYHKLPLWNEFSTQEYCSGLPCPPPGPLSNPGIEPRSPELQADSLPAEPPGKPKNTRVGSLSFLQRVFPARESNWGLLHCRWILYHLIYEGSSIK